MGITVCFLIMGNAGYISSTVTQTKSNQQEKPRLPGPHTHFQLDGAQMPGV